MKGCVHLSKKLEEQIPKGFFWVNLTPMLTSKRPKNKEAEKVSSLSLKAWLGTKVPWQGNMKEVCK